MAKIFLKFPTLITSELDTHFGQYTQMRNLVANLIDNYNDRPIDQKLQIPYRGKSRKKTIKAINTTLCEIGQVPSIIICVEEYKQGYADLYHESNANIVNIDPEDKIGSEQNYALLYPLIERNHYANIWINKWLVVIYDTPNKDDNDILNTIKYSVSKIFGFPFRFVLPSIFEGDRVIPELQVSYVELENNYNDNFIIHDKIVSSEIRTTKNVKYINLSLDEVEQIIQDTDDISGRIKRTIKMWLDSENRQATSTIKQECNENGEVSSYVASKYGYKKELSTEEMQNINDTGVMIHNFNEVITNYLTNGMD